MLHNNFDYYLGYPYSQANNIWMNNSFILDIKTELINKPELYPIIQELTNDFDLIYIATPEAFENCKLAYNMIKYYGQKDK